MSACETVFSVDYSGQRVVSIVDPAGRTASFTYDGWGGLVAARDGLDTAKGWPGFQYDHAPDERLASARSNGVHVSRRAGSTPTGPLWSSHLSNLISKGGRKSRSKSSATRMIGVRSFATF